MSAINGVVITLLKQQFDDRGWLVELYRATAFSNVAELPIMAYASMTEPGVIRGCHEHKEQTDNFFFFGPGTFILNLWDNRPESSTYKINIAMYVGDGCPTHIIVPPGVVHGYKNISSVKGFVVNAPNKLYKGVDGKDPEDIIRYENDATSPFRIE